MAPIKWVAHNTSQNRKRHLLGAFFMHGFEEGMNERYKKSEFNTKTQYNISPAATLFCKRVGFIV